MNITETAIVHVANLYRPRETWKPSILTCGNIRVEYDPYLHHGFRKLAKAMVAAGIPDGELDVIETGVKEGFGIRLSPGSIGELAALPVDRDDAIIITDAQREASIPKIILSPKQREALEIVQNSPEKWNDLHGKTKNTLTGMSLVLIVNGKPVLTDKGYAAINQPVSDTANDTEAPAKGENKVTATARPIMTIMTQKLLTALCTKTSAWKDAGPRTKNQCVSNGWVNVRSKDDATITSIGREALAAFVNTEEEAKPVVVTEKTILVTDKQREALLIVINDVRGWPFLHGKTQNFLTDRAQWVAIENGRPVLTEEGERVAKKIGIK